MTCYQIKKKKNMKNILISREIKLKNRIRILKRDVWSTLLYGAETWTLTEKTQGHLEAFEMWLYRRMLKIPWMEKVSYEKVLNLIGKGRELMSTIKKRKIFAEGFGRVSIHFFRRIDNRNVHRVKPDRIYEQGRSWHQHR